MNFNFMLFPSLFFLILIFCTDVQASSNEQALSSCRESLEATATPYKGFMGISTYRMFNKFPPEGLGAVSVRAIYGGCSLKLKWLRFLLIASLVSC